MPIQNYDLASIGNYQRTLNDAGELVLSGVYMGERVEQTTPSPKQCALFIDKANTKGDVVLIDASKLGETVKEG